MFCRTIKHVKIGSFFKVEINDLHNFPLRVVWQSGEKLTFGKKLFTTCFCIYLSISRVIYLKQVDPQSYAVVVDVVAVVVVEIKVVVHMTHDT